MDCSSAHTFASDADGIFVWLTTHEFQFTRQLCSVSRILQFIRHCEQDVDSCPLLLLSFLKISPASLLMYSPLDLRWLLSRSCMLWHLISFSHLGALWIGSDGHETELTFFFFFFSTSSLKSSKTLEGPHVQQNHMQCLDLAHVWPEHHC